jgi:pimeloyl-ACP methyl ester carboxylesterase
MNGRTNGPAARSVRVNGADVRIWEKGRGAPIVVLAGFGGLPRWPAFLERLSGARRVVAPSLPGFPGGGRGHETLDTQLDWLIATSDLVAEAGSQPVDLVGVSLGAALAADVAALWPERVRRLVLVSPLGLYDDAEPLPDLFAQKPGVREAMLTADPAALTRHLAKPDGEDELEWQIVLLRANEAAARLLWPLGDTGLEKRLHRIGAPTLVVAGEKDQVLPRSYARKFVRVLDGKAKLEVVAGAGHLVDLDAPEKLATLVLAHCGAAATAARPSAKARVRAKPKARAAAKRTAAPKRKAAAKRAAPAKARRAVGRKR